MNQSIKNIPSFIINLDTYPEKWQKSASILSSLGLTPQRFPAVYGKSLDPSHVHSITHPSVQYSIKNGRSTDEQIQGLGAIGCYLSHVKLWEMLLESDNEMFLIFEDDLSSHNQKNDLSIIENYISDVETYNPQWDLIYLGFYKPLPFSSSDIQLSSSVYQINEITFTTHAYLLHRRGAKKLLKDAFPIVHQVDSYMSFMASRGDIYSFRPQQSFFYQNTTYLPSTIQEGAVKSIKTVITRFRNQTIFIFIIIFLLLFAILFILFIRNIPKIRLK